MNTIAKKEDFPIFTQNPQLVYLDSAATALTPQIVIDKLCEYYTTYNANIARGLYAISTRATIEFEASRQVVAQFINARENEIVFTSGTTMSLNMIAYGLADTITAQNNIVTTAMEHHANFIPWQQLCERTGAQFRVATITEDGEIDQNHLLDLIDADTSVVALTHVSNVLGTINPIKEIIAKIRTKKPDTLIVIDAAQSIAHLPIDVADIDCDFLAFSMHKVFGPTGVGILYGKKSSLEKLRPVFTGGDMIESVSTCTTTFRELPHRLEAGTPHIAGVIATKTALDYLSRIGYQAIRAHEEDLLAYCISQLKEHFGETITIIGPKEIEKRSGLISFTFGNFHPHDIATILDDSASVAIRAGQHCTMPLHIETLHINATARASFSIYNTREDIDALITGLKNVSDTLSK
ncbi:MAG: SufS family cysteine desulfurase [Parcubacteria group bacterium]|jgi:cysteine desulfurase/selenocysteine lyase